MSTDKLTLSPLRTKSHDSRSVAIERGKLECAELGSFTLIKSRSTGWYDYVPGLTGVLFSDDVPMADYWKNMRGEWRHKTR